ncbi:MAG: response regulator, partial [Limisphaerales bacterium]
KILIVDDDERFLRALDKTLRNEGAVVTATHWPLNAMDILCHHEAPDLVITDLRMPLVTGGMLLRSMRLMSAALPIIVLTAFGSPETKEDLLRQGATAFLEKSLTADQLLAAIEKVFESQPAVQTPSEPG